MLHGEQLAELYAACRARLVVQLTAFTGDVTVAEDMVQEAFARAAARWPSVHRYADPEAWVRNVAFNLARSRWRWFRRRAGGSADISAGSAFSAGPELTPDLDSRVDLYAGLRRLPALQRQVVVLYYLADLSVDQIAGEMHVPAGTVKSWLYRARAQLTELLAEAESPAAELTSDG
jgi:RNA polymerase sigma-70 factor, ECF subfamily